MNLYDGLNTIPGALNSSAVAIGTFDGIHIGHQAIIRTAVEDAARRGVRSVVFTFDRHPAEVIAPGRAPDYLTTPKQRNLCIARLEVDDLVVANFSAAMAALTPDEFVQQILIDRLRAESVIVGRDFAFGRKRSGTVAYLLDVQARFGFQVRALDPVFVDGAPASSTRVRELLRSGNIQEAERVLGHGYWLAGTVVEGQRLGRELGFPTANLALELRQVVPQDGVYAVRVRLADGRLFPGACSIGDRPTVAGAGRSIETFLLGFSGDLYGQPIEIRFVERLRAEARFDSLEELTSQMARDVERARTVLADSNWE